MIFTECEQFQSSVGDEIEGTWVELRDRFFVQPTYVRVKEDGPMFFPGSFKRTNFEPAKDDAKRARRSASNVLKYHSIARDFDDGFTIEEATAKFKHLEYALYTSFNHTESKHKFRMVFPLTMAVSPATFIHYRDSLQSYFDDDTGCRAIGRTFNLPCIMRKCKDSFIALQNEGDYLDIYSFKFKESRTTRRGESDGPQPLEPLDLATLRCGLERLTIDTQEEAYTVGTCMKKLGFSDDVITPIICRGNHSFTEQILKTASTYSKSKVFQILSRKLKSVV